MSLTTYFIRKGNVGDTARTVGALYHNYKTALQTDDLKLIMMNIIKFRYDPANNSSKKADLIGRKLTLASEIKKEESPIDSLASLVKSILCIETSYMALPKDKQNIYNRVLQEELKKSGVPVNHICMK